MQSGSDATASSADRASLFEKWAVVTGSSSGIGRAIALQLAAAGANVIVHGFRKQAAAEQLATTLASQGVQAHALHGDLRRSEHRTQLIAEAWEIAPIDVWINNAGADVLTGAAADLEFEQKMEELWKVDVLATVQLARAAGQLMKQRGQGAIVNIGWDQAATGMAGDSGEMFAAIKGAVMAFTRSLAKSLAPEVRVNCIAPGWIRTDWGSQASEYWQERAVSESMLGRWGTTDDVARAVRFLVSSQASFVTGQILAVNGGQL